MQITIRKASEPDFPAIIALLNEFAQFQKASDKVSNTADQMLADKDLFHCFVAVNQDAEIIGYAACFFSYYTWSGKNLYLDDLYVRESARGNNIGTKLLHTVIDYAKQTNCKKLRWQVSNWNAPAIGFYKKMGAEIDDVEINCHLQLQ